MSPRSVSARTRQVLFDLLRRPGFSKSGLADYCGKPASWLSNFLHPGTRSKRPSFHLDELDDLAGYFRISLGDLLGVPTPGALAGDEGRLLLAFRALAASMQAHVLALIEQAALAPQIGATLQRATALSLGHDPQRTAHGDAPQEREVEARRLTETFYRDLAAIYAPARSGRQTSTDRRTSAPILKGVQPPGRHDSE